MEHLKERFLCAENFQQAWAEVAKNQGCAGADGETIAHFARDSDRYLAQLQQAVSEGRYRPMPLRQLFIPKRTGGWRELGVPPVRDRIVQQALLNVLHSLLEPQFEDCSFAYRLGRSHLLAVEKVAYWRRHGYEWVLDGDIVAPPVLMQQALVAALKEKQEPIPPPLFVVLGYGVRSPISVVISSDETTWEIDMATLYLVQQGTTVKLMQERFVIQAPQGARQEAIPEIPIREVERILVFGNVQLTTQVISTCLELQIPVIFLTQLGEYKGHLWSAEATDLLIETAQFERQKDDGFQLAIARSMVQGKLWNSKQLLLRLNRKRLLPEVAEAITKLDDYRAAVGVAGNTVTMDQVRGYEGAGAALYFPALGRLVSSPGFSLTGRTFHPPQDPMNSLLSFGYTLLLNNVFSLLLAEGLNPYLGSLHGAERQKAYLAFDAMEEFRSPIVDTLVMKLVNQKILKPTDFTYPNAKGGIYLEEPARRIFLKAFEARICEKVAHPDVQEPVSYRRVIQLQVKRYVRALLGNEPYEPFRRVI